MAYKAIIHPAFYKTFPASFKELLAENELWIRFGLHLLGELWREPHINLPLLIVAQPNNSSADLSDTLEMQVQLLFPFVHFIKKGNVFLTAVSLFPLLLFSNDNYYTLESGILILLLLPSHIEKHSENFDQNSGICTEHKIEKRIWNK